MYQHRAATGPMLAASTQYRPGTGTQRQVNGGEEEEEEIFYYKHFRPLAPTSDHVIHITTSQSGVPLNF